MNAWFDQFAQSLKEAPVSDDLKGAGTASAERAMAHYRFQHKAKVQECIEDHFGVTRALLGVEWQRIWNQFWASSPTSPRSLDFYPAVFLAWLQNSDCAPLIKELARFEDALEIHAWTQREYPACALTALTGAECIELVSTTILTLTGPVAESYQTKSLQAGEEKQHVYIWLTASGVHYRVMKPWEVQVLRLLPTGLENALGEAQAAEEEIAAFFQWLGSSGAIRSMV